MARVLLVLVLVAMLFVGSFAASQPAHSSGHKNKGKSCAKEFPGCKKCAYGLLDIYYCETCKDANAVFDFVEGKCVCDSDSGYGTLSKSQYKAWKKNNKKSYVKHSSGCVLCDNFGLVAEDGKCVEDITLTSGRRLLNA